MTLVRQSLVAFLSEQDGFLIVGQAADGERALQQTMEHRPDILVLDLNMPGKSGLEVLPRIRALAPDVKVLVLSGRDEDWYIMQALRSGAHGYILKTSADKDLVEGLHKVARGMMVLGDGVAQKVVGGVLRADSIIPDKMLTEMERQLLLHIAAGFDEDQVAERLHLNPDTQHTLVASVMLKMDAKDRHAAALQALRRGLILIDEVLQLGV